MYDLTQGFPDSWVTTQLEKEIASTCYENFFGRAKKGALVNCTWGGSPTKHCSLSKFDQIQNLVDSYKVSKILFYNLVDDYDTKWDQIIDFCKKKLGDQNVKLIGHHPTYSDLNIPFWALAVNRYFSQYLEEDLILRKIKNYYLCYNRKPHNHRVELFSQFKDKNLLKKGIFTLGSEDHRNSISIQGNTYSGNENAFIVDTNYSYAIPNDLMSLGSMEIWNTSLLNIVTETNYQTQGIPFLTEKTFKPIIGMRPFLILGPDGTIEWLHSNGFRTFNKDFNLPTRDLNIDDVVSAIKKLSIDKVNMKKIQKKIKQNRKRFFQFCREEEKRIGIG